MMTLETALLAAVGGLTAAVVSLAGAIVVLWHKSNQDKDDCNGRIDTLNDKIAKIRPLACSVETCPQRVRAYPSVDDVELWDD